MKRSLNTNAAHPENAAVPDEYRKTGYGKGARWMAVWFPASGRRCRRRFKRLADAEEFTAGLEDDIRAGRYVNPADGRRTVGEAAEARFAQLNSIRDGTWNRYRRDWNTHVAPYWADRQLAQVTPDAISMWVATLMDGTAATCRNGGLSPNTLRGIRSALSLPLSYAVEKRWLAVNPLDGSDWPKAVNQADRAILTVEQIDRLAEAAKTIGQPAKGRGELPGLDVMILFLAYTGLRIGEALALRVSDVDLEAMRVTVSKTLSADRSGYRTVEGPPKAGRTRKVPIPSFLRDGLSALMSGHAGGDYLFRTVRGGGWLISNWRKRVWSQAVMLAGLDGIDGMVPHALRHTYASIAIANGADVKTLQNAMGHAKASITLDVYADLWPDRLDLVTAAIDGAYRAAHCGSSVAVNVSNCE